MAEDQELLHGLEPPSPVVADSSPLVPPCPANSAAAADTPPSTPPPTPQHPDLFAAKLTDFAATLLDLLRRAAYTVPATNTAPLENRQALPVNRIAIALSGGADSLCLLSLLHRCRSIEPALSSLELFPVIVDHRLRPESTTEALAVRSYIRDRFGLEVTILTWHHKLYSPNNLATTTPAAAANTMARARTARYSLILRHCIAHQIPVICTGHHTNDQAETILQRIIFGSGIPGLSAIRPLLIRRLSGQQVAIIRPLLTWQRSEIEAHLRCQQLEWVDDPSNHNPRYDRTRSRHALAVTLPTALGIDPATLSRKFANLAASAQQANDFIDSIVSTELEKICHVSRLNFGARIALSDLERLHPEILSRMLLRLLRHFGGMLGGGAKMRLRAEQIAAIQEKIRSKSLKNHTIGGLLLFTSGGNFVIGRELDKAFVARTRGTAAAPVVTSCAFNAERSFLWDRRIVVSYGISYRAAVKTDSSGGSDEDETNYGGGSKSSESSGNYKIEDSDIASKFNYRLYNWALSKHCHYRAEWGSIATTVAAPVKVKYELFTAASDCNKADSGDYNLFKSGERDSIYSRNIYIFGGINPTLKHRSYNNASNCSGINTDHTSALSDATGCNYSSYSADKFNYKMYKQPAIKFPAAIQISICIAGQRQKSNFNTGAKNSCAAVENLFDFPDFTPYLSRFSGRICSIEPHIWPVVKRWLRNNGVANLQLKSEYGWIFHKNLIMSMPFLLLEVENKITSTALQFQAESPNLVADSHNSHFYPGSSSLLLSDFLPFLQSTDVFMLPTTPFTTDFPADSATISSEPHRNCYRYAVNLGCISRFASIDLTAAAAGSVEQHPLPSKIYIPLWDGSSLITITF